MTSYSMATFDVNVSAIDDTANASVGGTGLSSLNRTDYGLTHTLVTTSILGIVILLTIVGNVFVIAAIVLERNLHNVANYLIASLAVADLMVAALVMPLAAFNETQRKWRLGRNVCDMWVFFDVLCCTSSILHLLAIALDRYWAVTRLEYMRNRTAKRILMMIALSWIVSICISLPLLIGWKPSNSGDITLESCIINQDWGYTVFSTVGAFYLPSLLMLIIYLRIYHAAKSSIRKKRFRKKKGLPHTISTTTEVTHAACRVDSCSPIESRLIVETAAANGGGATTNGTSAVPPSALVCSNNNPTCSPPLSPLSCQNEGDHNHKSSLLDITKGYFERKRASPPPKQRVKEKLEQKRERKAARTLSIITGTFICSWLPFFVVALVRPFCGDACKVPPLLDSVLGWLGYFNSFLNPIIYTIFSPDFRLAFRKILFGKYNKGRSMR